jgi:dTDP-4-dehydrorhamnose 3,5-epimerase
MQLINGVKIKKLKILTDKRGRLMEILRRDDKEFFEQFGQVYMTTAKPGIVKAWHYHKKQCDHFCCVYGRAKVALYDARKNSPTYGKLNEFIIGEGNPLLIKIPAAVYHGFKCAGKEECLIVNIPTQLYNYKKPDEYRLDAYKNEINYDWSK